jgi:hypothetical protein
MKHSQSTIARFLPADLSMLLLKDLLFVRPFVAAILGQVRPDAVRPLRDYLFVNSGGAIEEEKVSKTFNKVIKSVSGQPLTLGKYRHFVKYIVCRYRISGLAGDWRGTENSEQFGHSVETSRSTYGVSSADLSGLRFTDMIQCIEISHQWHQFLLGHVAAPPAPAVVTSSPPATSTIVAAAPAPRASVRVHHAPPTVSIFITNQIDRCR